MYINKAYIIKTKTNLHVGSGDTNFGIVDKQVQRDTISNAPIINGSSLKGAIRDHFRDFLAQNNETIDNTEVKPFVFRTIFGDEQKIEDEEDKKTYSKLPKQGLVKFIDAKLLFVPLRSNKHPFYHVTSLSTLKSMKEFLESFGIKIDIETLAVQGSVVFDSEDAIVEDVECKATKGEFLKLKEIFGIENLAIFSDEDFNEALTSLPVIARNNLDPKNKNLWYEEVVPRESIFYTVFAYYNNLDDSTPDKRGKTNKKKFEMAYRLFDEKLLSESIQIGANASIGYGITDFTLLGANDE